MRSLRQFFSGLDKPTRAALLTNVKHILKGVIPTYYWSSLYPKKVKQSEDVEMLFSAPQTSAAYASD